MLSKSRPIKQASLGNPTRCLMDRRLEPLGNLNKCCTVRNTCGLPFNAPYACTGMHEFGNQLILTILFLSINTHLNHELNQGLAPPGLTHSSGAAERDQVRERTKHKQSKQAPKPRPRRGAVARRVGRVAPPPPLPMPMDGHRPPPVRG